jgi:hypothetical protein
MKKDRKNINLPKDIYEMLDKDMRDNGLISFPELFNYYHKILLDSNKK